MNGDAFEDWFEEKLLPNLPKNRKCVIVKDNAKYNSRLVKKTPSMKMKRIRNVSLYGNTHTNSNHLGLEPILLESIKKAKIPKEFIIDKLADR